MNSPSPDSMSRSRSITPSPTKKGRPPHHDGVLYGKTGICFSWKQLYAKARTTTLHLNEGVIGGDLFTIDINDYDMSWQGKLQEKHTIVMKNRSDSLSDIRWLYLGTDDEATAKGWYQYFISVMDRSPSKTIGDMGRQDEDIFHKDKPRASTLGDKNKGGSPPFASQNEKGYDLIKSPNKNINGMQEYVEQDLVDTGVEDDFSVEGGDFMLPEDAPEWVHALYGEHIASKSIWREAGQTIPKGGQWEMLADEGDKIETAIANSNLDRQMFRCEYSFRRIPVQVLVKALLDVEKKRDWDNTVESLKVLFYTPTTKQSILQQINKAQGKFQFKREFVYIRYIFQTQGAYFIIEKSHKGDGLSDIIGLSKDMAYRGHTDYSIMRIIEKDDRSYVTHLIKTTNGGFVSTAQDTKMTLNSLINLKNVEKIFPLYWDEDESDLVLIPCPKREEKLRWRQMIVNKSNKKKPVVSPTRPKFHLNIPNLNRDNIVPHGVSNRSRSARSVKTHRTDEENLQEEDIDEKILVLSKQKKQDMWEIELSTSSKQVSPDYLGIYNKKIV